MRFAEIATALEIYCIDHGTYPTSLSALVPGVMDLLPSDLAGDGHTLVYSLEPDGRPMMYSVGYNGTDEQGRRDGDNREGNWTWRYSPRQR